MQVDISGDLQKILINSRIFWRILVSSRFASRVWGRHAPTRSLGKLARVWEVKSRMDRKFSRIENLWPRDGSCPPPLCSKRIDRVCAAALSGSLTESVRSWHGITFRRLMKDSRYSMKKAGRSADTTFCFFHGLIGYLCYHHHLKDLASG